MLNNISNLYVGFAFELMLPEGYPITCKVLEVTHDGVKTNQFPVSQVELMEAGVITKCLSVHSLYDVCPELYSKWYKEDAEERAKEEADRKYYGFNTVRELRAWLSHRRSMAIR